MSEDELDEVYLFRADGTFDLHIVPGKSNKERTLNSYILTGLGIYLASNAREFTDERARAVCQQMGCLDTSNHATYLKDKGSEFSGDKARGWLLSNVGLKSGAALVKAASMEAKKA